MAPINDSRSGRISKRLIALSSAAVLTVYGAGYMRTRAAAARFDEEAVPRQRPTAASIQSAAAAPTTMTAARPAALAEDAAASPGSSDPIIATSSQPTEQAARAPQPSAATSPTTPGLSAERPATSTITANRADNAPSPAPSQPVAVVADEAATASQPEAPATPPPPAAPIYKDGTYRGWGTSRHGNIQATVTIAGGRIASAVISQCHTRYSCSVIDVIIPQVARRQSPEVDYVSGATQSTNAFYYAVVEALHLASAN